MPHLFAGYFLYFSAKLGDAGFASHSFDKKGIAQSPLVGDEADMDAAMDAAIEAGAEDVVVATDDDDQNVLQVRYWWWQLLAYQWMKLPAMTKSLTKLDVCTFHYYFKSFTALSN